MRYNILNETQLRILGFLLDSEESPSIRSLSRHLGNPYPWIYNNILKLEKLSLIQRKNVPPAQLISIKTVSIELLIDLENKKKQDFLEKNKWIEIMLEDLFLRTNNRFFILLIFGSYAKDKQSKKSDLDLLVITQRREDINELDSAIRSTYTKIKKNAIVVTIEDFNNMIKNNKEFNVGNEAIKKHIVLYGVEQYYQLIK